MPLLRRIAHTPDRPLGGADVAVVVAHPDDETLGCGGLLGRLSGGRLIVVTDGAPREGADASRCGFSDPGAYGTCRRAELIRALAVARVPASALILLDVPDQGVCHRMAEIARALARLFAIHGIRSVFTHAFEGGHPDHDGIAFCVRLAADLPGSSIVEIIEMPLYHLGEAGICVQRFCDGDHGVVIDLKPGERMRKRRMLACHATQTDTLRPFSVRQERFRAAPDYCFAALPNRGRCLYGGHDWGLSPADWPACVGAARRAFERLAA
ncbi:PIG-L deacetylase family protein [Chelatococcus reniformis]|uniref:PIG-L family deacetylase n=1 Tax=Chelatococcus reniformis TaxID=1494448 RepID=A0A916XJM1_9HYPH|nr:PIG-L family deacetylase [Chelatococcus reniformis]GGC78472.1 hypothetical protein GCM10010994_40820 [Chelatococcus reniformis]